eukprot:4932979-Pyramimonas_sp.AAC.1
MDLFAWAIHVRSETLNHTLHVFQVGGHSLEGLFLSSPRGLRRRVLCGTSLGARPGVIGGLLKLAGGLEPKRRTMG